MRSRRFLLTGATGFIGKRLAQSVLEQNYQLTVLTRQLHGFEKRFPFACDVYPWRPSDATPPLQAFTDVDVVVHLAGENIGKPVWSKAQAQILYNSRILSTRNLVRALAASRSAKPRLFVSASAVGFYGDRNHPVDEDAKAGSDFLARLCQDWEAAAEEASEMVDRLVLLRMGVVVGAHGGMLAKLIPVFRAGLGAKLGDGRQWMSWIHIDDLIQLILHLVDTPSIQGPVNVVTPNPVRNRDFTRMLATALKRRAPFTIPKIVLKLLYGRIAPAMLASQRIIPSKALQSGFRFQLPQLEAALNAALLQQQNE